MSTLADPVGEARRSREWGHARRHNERMIAVWTVVCAATWLGYAGLAIGLLVGVAWVAWHNLAWLGLVVGAGIVVWVTWVVRQLVDLMGHAMLAAHRWHWAADEMARGVRQGQLASLALAKALRDQAEKRTGLVTERAP